MRFLLALMLWLLPVAACAQGVPISGLPVASTPLSGSELTIVVQSGVTKQSTVGAITGQAFSPGPSGNFACWNSGAVVLKDCGSAPNPASSLKCDGSTDITSALNALITTAQAAGGGTLRLPAGNCKITGTISITGSGIHIVGQGPTATTITPATGSYNAFSFSGSGSAQDGSIESLTINAAALTGYDIAISAYNRTVVRDVIGQNTYNFLINTSSNAMDVDNVNVFSVRGPSCFVLAAPGSARSDVMDFVNVTCGGAGGSTYVGLTENGFVNTVNIHEFAVSAPDGIGLLVENTNGGSAPPDFFIAHNFQVEQASGKAGLDFEAASDVYCTDCYSSSNTNDGVYVSTSSYNINLTASLIELNGKYGIEDYASAGGTGTFGMTVTGGQVSGNSHSFSGTYPEILVGAATFNTVISGVDLNGGLASYGVTVQAGAQDISLIGNNYVAALSGAVHDLSGVASIVGGVDIGGGPLGPSLINGGVSATKELVTSNGGTSSSTHMQMVAATGTANAYILLDNQDGGSPGGTISTGSGDTAGLTISTGAGNINMIPAPASNIAKVIVSNPGTLTASQSEVAVQTGTANAYLLLGNQDGSTLQGSISTGVGDTGGMSFQALAGNITISPPATGIVALQAPIALQGYTVSTVPTCNTARKGGMAYVTDALTPTYNGALTGGSSTIVPVFCTGAAWTSH